MSIFNKKLDDITFSDIEALVTNGVAESQVLEYKSRWNAKQAAKVISSMANTYGGIIVYGVVTDSDTNKPTGFVELETRKLDDAVESVCIDSIHPFLVCDCQYISSEDGEKTVFLIRVPESDLTPHAVDNNTTVYIRMRSQKRRIEREDVDKIEWLRHRRKRVVEQRESMMAYLRLHQGECLLKRRADNIAAVLELGPTYPIRHLIDHSHLRFWAARFVGEYSARRQDLIRMGTVSHVDLGLLAHSAWKEEPDTIRLCWSLNVYGMLRVEYRFPKLGSERNYLSLEYLCEVMIASMDFGNQILNNFGFLGTRTGLLSLKGIKNTKTFERIQGYEGHIGDATGHNTFEESITSPFRLLSGAADESRREACDFLSRVIHLYGVTSKANDIAAAAYDASLTRIGGDVVIEQVLV